MVTWEEVITEPGPTGVLVAYTGGAPGASYNFTAAHAEAPGPIVAARGGSNSGGADSLLRRAHIARTRRVHERCRGNRRTRGSRDPLCLGVLAER